MLSYFISSLLFISHITSTNGQLETDGLVDEFMKPVDTVNEDRIIVGGEEAIPGRYPYAVALVNKDSNLARCGGSLIAPDWVLTAAHCIGYVDRVNIGRHNFSDPDETYEEIMIKVQSQHPKFNKFFLDYDFGLLQLMEPSSSPVVKLDDGSTDLNIFTDMTVMGWGTTESEGNASDVLLETELDFWPNFLCRFSYFYAGGIRRSMMCARRKGKDSCQGDSGGPLIIKGQNSTTDILVGVVSWGFGCANRIFPGVYARVSVGHSVIVNTVNEQKGFIEEKH